MPDQSHMSPIRIALPAFVPPAQPVPVLPEGATRPLLPIGQALLAMMSVTGAAQSENLAMPPSVEVFLARGGNGLDYVGTGWSVPELHGAWTIGHESSLHIPGLDSHFDYLCWLPIGPYRHPPEILSQGLRIVVNGFEIFEGVLDRDHNLEFVIPAAVVALRASLDIVLHCSTPTAPTTFALPPDAVPDGRMLGFAVWGLRLTPQHAVPLNISNAGWLHKLNPAQRVAAVTMVFNEAEYLPIWLAHYARQVGIENCYVIDHGSTDGSTVDLGRCNVVRIPRSPYDPAKQSEWNSHFCSSLLTWFDWVIYSDVDEILMADPAVSATLAEYCRYPLPEVVTAVGLNVLHLVDDEPPLDLSRPVSEQRPYVFGCASMCKPLLIKRRVEWSPGSHSSDAPLAFDRLYMFHLRWFDQPLGLRRLQRTRAMTWAQDNQGAHQRVADHQLEAQMRDFGRHPRFDAIDLDPQSQPLLGFLNDVRASTIGRENDLYKIDLGIWYPQLWRLPKRFIGTF